MNHTTTEIIAKEGWRYIAISFIAFIILLVIDFKFLALTALLVTLFNLFLFRNTEREPSLVSDDIITSPIDGVVLEIKEEKEFNKIKIMHSFFETHILRSPVNMKIKKVQKRRGLFLDINSKESLKLNEKVEITANFRDEELTITLLAGKLSRTIEVFESDEFISGARFALMLDGLVEIKLPKNILIKTEVGDKLLARNSVIAQVN